MPLLLLGDLSSKNASVDDKFSSEFKEVQSLEMTPTVKADRAMKTAQRRDMHR